MLAENTSNEQIHPKKKNEHQYCRTARGVEFKAQFRCAYYLMSDERYQ
jgi:hypothetical protein